jgi:DNA-binding CsgD family transcriptional regulator
LEREEHLDADILERLEQALIGGGIDYLPAMPDVLARARRYLERARRGELRDPRTLSALAVAATFMGAPADEAAGLARDALGDERLLLRWLDDGYVTASLALCWTDRLEEAKRALDRGLVEAQLRGSAPMCFQLASVRSETALRAGDLDIAEDYSQRALELCRELGPEHIALMWLPVIYLESGRLPAAVELIEPVEIPDSTTFGVTLRAVRGRVRVASGRREQGIADMLAADRTMAGVGCDLSLLIDWVPTSVRALVDVGRDEQARHLAHRELKAAVAFGAPRRHGIALSACGLLDPGDRGLELLREATAVLERSPARLEHARALVNLGVGLRARGAGDRAREPLSLGLDIAHRCRALTLAQRARAELIATGARPRREVLSGLAALTPGELRAARMAADGLTNRAIAQALFVSAKTVEAQLSHAYAKLAIRGRAQLAAALSETERDRGHAGECDRS